MRAAGAASLRALGCFEHRQIKADCRTDHLAEHGREVLVQQQPGRGGERGAVCENSSHVRPELAHRAVIEQPSRSLADVRSYLFAMAVAKIPQVTLEMHERHGRALPLQGWARDRRPEVVDQLADRARSLGVRSPR